MRGLGKLSEVGGLNRDSARNVHIIDKVFRSVTIFTSHLAAMLRADGVQRVNLLCDNLVKDGIRQQGASTVITGHRKSAFHSIFSRANSTSMTCHQFAVS
jgi:hypothetical protein